MKSVHISRIWLPGLLVLCLLAGGWLYMLKADEDRKTLPSHTGGQVSIPMSSVSTPRAELAPANSGGANGAATVVYRDLPSQAQAVYTLIFKGGPFKFRQDGTVFGNNERRLPMKGREFYREYTVHTPGVNHRGARRIVCGGEVKISPQICYYTQDHYGSFRQVVDAPQF